MHGLRSSLAAFVVSGLLAGCAAQVGHVGSAQADGRKITVDASGPCPTTLGDATDVAVSPVRHAKKLVPDNISPTAGLICEYGLPPDASPDASTPELPAPQLTHAISLTLAQARELASAISEVSVKPPSGGFACPAQLFGTVTVIAFAYAAAQTADLWYQTSGCRTLDNGDVSAFQGANPSFYSGFETVFAALVPD